MIPIWQHLTVVLTLLCSNLATVYFADRAIHRLRNALVAKRVLLGDDRFQQMLASVTPASQFLIPGDTLQVKSKNGLPVSAVIIETDTAAKLEVRLVTIV